MKLYGIQNSDGDILRINEHGELWCHGPNELRVTVTRDVLEELVIAIDAYLNESEEDTDE